MAGRVAVVLCGSAPPSEVVTGWLPRDPVVIAADGGYRHAAPLGLVVEHLVGDLDSISSDDLDAARCAGVVVETHSADKDESDLELALRCARRLGVDSALVIDGGVGPRVDHFLANALVLASARWLPMRVHGLLANSFITAVRPEHGPVEVRGEPGSLVTVLAVGGTTCVATSEGLRWSLTDAPIAPNSARGISNELLADRAELEVRTGALLVIQPEVWS